MENHPIQNKLEQFKHLISTINPSNKNSQAAWNLKREIHNDFKIHRFEDKDKQQKIWEAFSVQVTALKAKQAEINSANEKSGTAALQKLQDFEAILKASAFTKEDFVTLKSQLSETREFLKQSAYPSREMREKAWSQFYIFKNQLKEEENKYYAQQQFERISNSQDLTEQIIRVIDVCHPNAAIEDMLEQLKLFVNYATQNGLSVSPFEWVLNLQEPPKNTLKMRSEGLRDIRKFIRQSMQQLTKTDKQEIFSRLDIVQADLDAAWSEYKAEKERQRKEWEQRQAERKQRHEAWLSKQIAFAERLGNILEKQIHFKEKMNRRLESQKSFLAKVQQSLEKQERFLVRQERHLEDLEDKYYSARSENYRNKVSEWMDEAENRITDVEQSIVSKNAKIKEVEESIVEISNKIVEVQENIEQLETKIKDVKAKLMGNN